MKQVMGFVPLFISLMVALLLPSPVLAEICLASRVGVQGLSQPQKLTLLAAQGLMNRTGSNVFLDFGADNRWMQMDYTEKPERNDLRLWSPAVAPAFQEKYPTINEAWIDILTKSSHFKFTTELWESFLARAGSVAKGWLIYDNFEDEVALMGTLAGQKDALPVQRQDLPADADDPAGIADSV